MPQQWTTTTPDPELFPEQQDDQGTGPNKTAKAKPTPPTPLKDETEEIKYSGTDARPGHPGDDVWSAPESGTVR